MTADQYRAAIQALQLTQEQAGEYFGASKRSGQRWAADGPPLLLAMLLLKVPDRTELDRLQKKAAKSRK